MKKLFRLLAKILLSLFVLLNVMSAFHAYKFTHFYDPATADTAAEKHMNALQTTGAILFGTKFYRKPVTDSLPLPHETFELITSDGFRLQGWYAPRDSAIGTIILFHGHAGNRAGPGEEALEFYKWGYNICLVDFRAHGNSSGTTCTIGYKEAADVKATYDFVKAKGDKNVVLWGVSLGAATILKAMDEYKDIQPSKVILQMPFGSLEEAVKGRLRMMGLPQQPLSSLLTFWGGLEQGFWAFNFKPYVYARSMKVPVLLQWGRIDKRVSQVETEAIFANLGSAKKQLVFYENSGHESLLKVEPAKWKKTTHDFLKE